MNGLVAQVSQMAGISSSSCRLIARGAHRRYKKFTIRKKNGGIRVVAQPAREVKAIQRAICVILSEKLFVHASATAYKIGSSILSNAAAHADSRYLSKFDFSEFFPSIGADSLINLLAIRVPNLSEAEVRFVVDACTWRPNGRAELCIGAPSSPLLSNAVMYSFDENISSALAEMGVSYTRYSDDISISSKREGILADAELLLRAAVARSRFPVLRMNEEKRVAVGRGVSMIVTGLTLTNQGGVSVGRVRKRGVRAGVEKFVRFGATEVEFARLKGELAFVLSVEPEFRQVLIRTHGERILRLLPR
ncbi:MAG: retron St85 family RNA-directed DNA polymerase [Stenotrophomonas indicatrix]|uniref:retron St85 family RNA-directed DNA polymerase n=1 Tax=Stenotrophomonas indicatrix TaxID=2045451 RepID=UPI003C7B4A8B